MKVENVRISHTLRGLIEQAIEAKPKASAADIAKYVLLHHAAVVNAWALERLTALCQTMSHPPAPMVRNRPRLGHPAQGRLPGFEDVPEWIYIPSVRHKYGIRKRLLNATLADQIASLEMVLNESTTQLAQRRRLIALTRRYEKDQPGITVREVLKRQAARSAEAARKRASRVRARQGR